MTFQCASAPRAAGTMPLSNYQNSMEDSFPSFSNFHAWDEESRMYTMATPEEFQGYIPPLGTNSLKTSFLTSVGKSTPLFKDLFPEGDDSKPGELWSLDAGSHLLENNCGVLDNHYIHLPKDSYLGTHQLKETQTNNMQTTRASEGHRRCFLPLESILSESPVLTSKGKSSPLVKELSWERDDSKLMKLWSSVEVMYWLSEKIQMLNYEFEKVQWSNFYVDGSILLKMTEHEFIEKDPNVGSHLFKAVKNRKKQEKELHLRTIENDIDSDESDSSSNDGEKSPVKRRQKKERKSGYVWEFLRDLLKHPMYCPKLICWDNHKEGVFRFVQTEEVAKLWGHKKGNPNMTYDKLSRAMRQNYKKKRLLPVYHRKLVYKFGPEATGWRMDDPINV